MWVNGPFKAGTNDKAIFNAGLVDMIPEGKVGLADRGYKRQEKLSIPSVHDTDEVKTFKKRALARHETANEKLKRFNILSERFRHIGTGEEVLQKHQVVFEACCVLVQYDMECGSPLFNI